MNILEVKNLSIDYLTNEGKMEVVRDINFTLKQGERLGLIGESGSGKTTLAKSLMTLLPENGKIINGKVLFKQENILAYTSEEQRKLKWKEISMIPQSSMNALNPVYRIRDQIIEAIQAHVNFSSEEIEKRMKEVFSMIGLDEKRLDSYPHQLSGGMKQRATIAMAFVLNPPLIIADEPTTALDVIVQDRILQEIIQMQEDMNNSMIFITHDISVVSEICHSVIVLYGGKIMEKTNVEDFFQSPYHPYSIGLQNSSPSIKDIGNEKLISIPGNPPSLINPKPGCRFQDRCPFVTDLCKSKSPELVEVTKKHFVACHYTEEVEKFRSESKKESTWNKVNERLHST